MEASVAPNKAGNFGQEQLADGLFSGFGGDIRIDSGQGRAQPFRECEIAVAVTLGGWFAGRDVRAVENLIAECGQPLQRRFFDDGLSEFDGGSCPLPRSTCEKGLDLTNGNFLRRVPASHVELFYLLAIGVFKLDDDRILRPSNVDATNLHLRYCREADR